MKRFYLMATAAVLGFVAPTMASAHQQWSKIWETDWATTNGRSQGVTNDGKYYYFSSTDGVQKTDMDFNILVQNTDAIPAVLKALGDSHIGDVEYYKGMLYLPIEDEDIYKQPHIAVFDAATLTFTGTSYALDPTLQTDGVPWVGIDASTGRAYTSTYDNATQLNVYDVKRGFKNIGAIKLSQSIDAVQGAKVLGHYLYAATTDANYTVYKIDLRNGYVTVALQLSMIGQTDLAGDVIEDQEQEGIDFLNTARGPVMQVLERLYTASTGPGALLDFAAKNVKGGHCAKPVKECSLW